MDEISLGEIEKEFDGVNRFDEEISEAYDHKSTGTFDEVLLLE